MKGNTVKIRVEGLNIDRQLARLSASVNLFDVVRKSRKVVVFQVNREDESKALAFFPSECYNVTILGTEGVFSVFDGLKKRPALFLCVIVCFCALFFLNGFVWRVEISGEPDDVKQVESVLKQRGIGAGSLKSSLDLDLAENLICNSLQNIKYAIISLKGCTVFVELYQKDVPEDIVDLNKPQSIYSNTSGVISRMLVISGTPRVSVGDKVEKGQLLIEGVRTFADGTQTPVCAAGEVYATVTSVGYETFDGYADVTERTGKKQSFCFLSLFGFKQDENFSTSFEDFEVERKVSTLFPLPISIVHVDVYECVKKRVSLSFDDNYENLKSVALKKAVEAAGDAEISEKNFGFFEEDGKYTVWAEVYAEVRIDFYKNGG